eukprot:scaffold224851_cov14-Tisochrysis_lutea.AAC.1
MDLKCDMDLKHNLLEMCVQADADGSKAQLQAQLAADVAAARVSVKNSFDQRFFALESLYMPSKALKHPRVLCHKGARNRVEK